MALSYVSSTTPQTFTGNPLTIGVNHHASYNAGDLIVMTVGCHPDTKTITTPDGWNAPTNSNEAGGAGSYGANSGPCRVAMFWKISDGSEGGTQQSVSVSSASSSVCWAVMIRISSGTGNYDVVCTSGVDSSAGGSWSVTGADTLDIASGDFILVHCTIPTSASNPSTVSAESISIPGCTFSFSFGDTITVETTTNNDIAGRGVGGSITAGSASGPPTHACTWPSTNTAVAGPEVFMRIREASAGVEGAAALSAESSQSASGVVNVHAAVGLTSQSSLTAATRVDVKAATDLTGQSSLAAAGSRGVSGASGLVADSLLVADGQKTTPAAAGLTSQSSLTVGTLVDIRSSSTLSGDGVFQSTAVVNVQSSTAIAADGVLTSSSYLTYHVPVTLSSDGTLAAFARLLVDSSASLTADSVLFADGVIQGEQNGRADLSAQTTLSAGSVVLTAAAVGLSTESQLIASSVISALLSAQLSSESLLQSLAFVVAVAGVALEGESDLVVSVFDFIPYQPKVVIVYKPKKEMSIGRRGVIIVYKPKT